MKYNFTTTWHIPASLEKSKATIYDVEQWQYWWPGLENLRVIRSEPDHIGDSAAMTWRSSSGYRLHLTIIITDITSSGDLLFHSTGDLVGTGSWHFSSAGTDETVMTIVWSVTPTRWWMRYMNFLLRPLFVANHHRLMRDGEEGLRAHLRTDTSAAQMTSPSSFTE